MRRVEWLFNNSFLVLLSSAPHARSYITAVSTGLYGSVLPCPDYDSH